MDFDMTNVILKNKKRNLKILETICVKKNEKQPNGKVSKYSKKWWYKVECLDCGYIYYSSRGKIISREDNCPCCSANKVVIRGINDFNTKKPHLSKYIVNIEEGFKVTPFSNKKVLCKCPHCGTEKTTSFNRLSSHGFYCNVCSDNISFPNKCFINILTQLDTPFTPEFSPFWIGKKRYDFLIKDTNIIIEADGKQHNDEVKFMISLEEQKNIDYYKDFMALKNGYKVIRIDCSVSEVDYIIKSISNSCLASVIDVDKINKKEVEMFARSNLLLKACELKLENDRYTTRDIGNILNISQNTIARWLKIGNRLGLCIYDAKVESKRNTERLVGLSKEKNIKAVVVYDKNGNFILECKSIKELSENSMEKLGVFLSKSNISYSCRNKSKTCKGFIVRFKNDEI